MEFTLKSMSMNQPSKIEGISVFSPKEDEVFSKATEIFVKGLKIDQAKFVQIVGCQILPCLPKQENSGMWVTSKTVYKICSRDISLKNVWANLQKQLLSVKEFYKDSHLKMFSRRACAFLCWVQGEKSSQVYYQAFDRELKVVAKKEGLSLASRKEREGFVSSLFKSGPNQTQLFGVSPFEVEDVHTDVEEDSL